MKAKLFVLFFAVLVNLMVADSVMADTVPNPDTNVFLDDINGTGYFIPDGNVTVFQTFDYLESLGISPGIEFGFFLKGETDTLFPVFDASDTNVSFEDPRITGISFEYGKIIDYGDNTELDFTYNNEDIGFYIIASGTTLFSDPSLNPGAQDYAGTFAFIDNTSADYAIAFGYAEDKNPFQYLAIDSVKGITPAVPIPGSFLLLFSGFLALAGVKRKP